MVPLEMPLRAFTPDCHLLARIIHQTQPLKIVTSGNHREEISFLVFAQLSTPVLLGFTWLYLHNPHTDWQKQRILSWSVHCHGNCLRSAPFSLPPFSLRRRTLRFWIPQISPRSLSSITALEKYLVRTGHSPSHLIVLTTVPLTSSRAQPFLVVSLYSLSRPEREAMEKVNPAYLLR